MIESTGVEFFYQLNSDTKKLARKPEKNKNEKDEQKW